MNAIFASILLFFSGLFVSHTNHASIAAKPITTAYTPIPTPTCQDLKTGHTTLKYTPDMTKVLLQGCTPTPTQMPTPQQGYPIDTPKPYQENIYVPEKTYDYNEFPTPTPKPVYQHKTVTCTTNGNFTTCSDGTSYTTNGNHVQGSDGTSITTVGNTTYVNGGSNVKSGSCITNGSYSNCSNGSSAINTESTSFISGKGTSETCQHFGNMTTCN